MFNTKTPTDLTSLQVEYDSMVAIAMRSIDAGVDLDPRFERELTALMRVIKSMGGNVR